MKVKSPPLTPAEVRKASEEWFDKQLSVLERCHGRDWPANREWVEGYLKEQLRQRLLAVGWRPKA